jgi:hypothetical protein
MSTEEIEETIESMIGLNIYALWDNDYDSYEIRGEYAAAQDIAKWIEDHFVRKSNALDTT